MGKRVNIGNKTRFEVFKRDLFTCVYCGKKPPGVVLEVDHVIPVFEDGENDIGNLVTSCFECNRGKGKTSLKEVPTPIKENLDTIKEKELQIKEMAKFLSVIRRRERRQINKVAKIYSRHFTDYELTDSFKKNSIGNFLKKLPLSSVESAMEIAIDYLDDDSNASIKYFCGICWKMIRGEGPT